MGKKKILVQLDSDSLASVFDAVVAIDAGVDHLLSYAGVEPLAVRGLVHGAIFTRGIPDLKSTAIFVGGSDVQASEILFKEVLESFFGPMRVSVLMDSNGSNSTAVAAVLCARKAIDLSGKKVLVLAGTGPVGMRVSRLAVMEGANCLVHSRSMERARQVCHKLREEIQGARVEGVSRDDDSAFQNAIATSDAIIACGAAGAELITTQEMASAVRARVVIDLNAVPPLGIPGVQSTDKGRQVDGKALYGALGVGGLKMKIHKAAIAALFERNDAVLGCDELMQIGKPLAEG